MTSGRAGGMKNREPLKADCNGYHLKVALDLVPGSGARTWGARIKAPSIHGPNGGKFVIPAKAGIQVFEIVIVSNSRVARLRGHDELVHCLPGEKEWG